MKIVWIANESPFPATHGGRVDIWRRLCALHEAGAEVYLIFWCGDSPQEQPTAEHLAVLQQKCRGISCHVIGRGFWQRLYRLLMLCRWPLLVSTRQLAAGSLQTLYKEVEAFAPDAVWLDGIYGGLLAEKLADHCRVPLFIRSHNIEYLYTERQYKKATTLRSRLAQFMNIPHLQKLETRLLGRCRQFFDISADDLAFWQRQGLRNGQWLPPMVDTSFARQLSAPWSSDPEYDVGYLGNLYSPNNVDGVLWFVEQVVPLLRAENPALRIFIAGSRPVPAIRAATEANQVTLVESPADIVPVLRNARVLVNPVFAGSGVNIKSVEMLFTPARLVSTNEGVAGLPDAVKHHFQLANSPLEFKAAILQSLGQDTAPVSAEREAARGYFAASRAVELLQTLRGLVP